MVPGVHTAGFLLGKYDDVALGADQLAERRQRLAWRQPGEPVQQPRALERVPEVGFADVILIEQNQHLVWVGVQEAPDRGEEVDKPRRAELAQRVAQPDVALAAGRAMCERLTQPLERFAGQHGQLGGHPVQARPFGGDVGVDPAGGALDRVVR